MVGRRPTRHAQVARGDILDQERQAGLGSRARPAPARSTAMWWWAPAAARRADGKSGPPQSLGLLSDRVGANRPICEPATRLRETPPGVLRGRRAGPKGDQLNVG